ncbi:two component transcriptional regulator, winged helix family [Desulforamulus reducens MI-1]|uniref:Stage 0 sporulation protein A homolog n=1 Tax=Desulforamulus reducens (strain ATCC BAA-1160 / DSM 100696 / MI-1) TaxID=349161 RepID=A4J5S1_DESRM|nr:response regulator transcription factor [Desulforamulus reducens]ABO50424.1 two component transcriptional regulator, winged helix family [Desulforamulus reducens MI-1]
MPKLLIVDDEEKIRNLIKVYLVKEGFEVDELDNGNRVVDSIKSSHFDMVVLDIMLPGPDGLSLCKEIRKISNIPIIMLTAKGDEIDRIIGLEVGADDYIVKPFSPRELVARINAILRRVAAQPIIQEDRTAILSFSELTINPDNRTVEVRGSEIALTPKEFDLLYFMAKTPGRAFSRENLLENVWGYDFYGDLRTVDTHINRLRDKLNMEGTKQAITTVWGVGYKFEVTK